MPRDSNGNTVPLPGTIVSTGDTILPSQHNPMVNDVYAMMTQSLSRDGQGGMRSTLDMSGFRIINVGSATQTTDAVSLGQFQNGTPVGSVVDYAGSSAPPTWMLCYGQAVSRTAYAALFSAIGTTFGSGDGSTTFNLPDARGLVVAGRDNMGGVTAGKVTVSGSGIDGKVIGANGGEQSQTLTIDQIPSHNHGGKVSVGGSHTHEFTVRGQQFSDQGGSRPTLGGANFNQSWSSTTASDGNHDHNITSQGGGKSHSSMQPTIIMNKIIKVSY